MEKLNFAKVTILSGIVTAVRLICGLLVSKIVAVYTGPAGIANLGQLQNFVSFINGFISSQVSQGVNRFTAEHKGDYGEAKLYWRSALKLSFIACCIIVIAGVLSSEIISKFLFKDESHFWLIILALSVVPLNVINSIFLGVLNGLSDYNKYFLANLLAIFSSLVSMSTLVYFFGINGALISAALNNALAGIWLIIIILKRPWFKLQLWIGSVPKKPMLEMRNYFLMGIIGAVTGPVSLITVRSIITNDFSIEAAGYWQAVLRISEAYLAVLTTALTVYYFPKTAAAKTKNEHLSVLKTGAIVVIPLAFLMATTIYVLKDWIIRTLFSEDFNMARELFLFQNIGDLFRIASWLFATILLAKGYFKINACLELIFSLMLPVLVKLLTPVYHLQGISIAYFSTYFIYLITTAIIYIWHINNKVQNA